MGKRPEPQAAAPGQAQGQTQAQARSGIVTALGDANKAMKVAYDTEYGQRLQLVRENEAMERETLALEVEIKGLTDREKELQETVATLSERHDEIRDVVNHQTEERDGFAENNKELASLQKQLDEEVTRLKRLQQDYMSAVGKFREARKKITGD